MGKIPERFVCDICGDEIKTTPTGKRDYLTAHVARLTEDAGDRLYTLDKPKLATFELDLCDTHLELYTASLPIQATDSGRGDVSFKFKKELL